MAIVSARDQFLAEMALSGMSPGKDVLERVAIACANAREETEAEVRKALVTCGNYSRVPLEQVMTDLMSAHRAEADECDRFRRRLRQREVAKRKSKEGSE